jgi:hypothetical protein
VSAPGSEAGERGRGARGDEVAGSGTVRSQCGRGRDQSRDQSASVWPGPNGARVIGSNRRARDRQQSAPSSDGLVEIFASTAAEVPLTSSSPPTTRFPPDSPSGTPSCRPFSRPLGPSSPGSIAVPPPPVGSPSQVPVSSRARDASGRLAPLDPPTPCLASMPALSCPSRPPSIPSKLACAVLPHFGSASQPVSAPHLVSCLRFAPRVLSSCRVSYLVFVPCLMSCLRIVSRVLSSYRVSCAVFVSRLVSCLRTASCRCFVSCPHLAPCPCLSSCLRTAPRAPSSYRVACLIFVSRLVFVFHPIFVLVPCLASTTTPHSPRLVPHSSPLATVADLPPTRLNFTAAWPGLAHVSSACHKHFTLMLTSLHWYRSNLTSKPAVRPLLARDTGVLAV